MEHQAESILKKLRDDEAKIINDMRTAKIDFSDAASADAFEAKIGEIFRERIRAYREIDKRGNVLRINDWEDNILERRKQAVSRLSQTAQERLGEKVPALCAAEEFVRLGAPCNTLTFDTLNSEYDVELAAAIWMLDYLDSRELFGDAAAFFPQLEEELRSVELPNLTDAAHSDDALRAMKYLIRNRNRGRKGFDESKAWMDAADAETTDASQEIPEDRQRFDAVIALVDDETKDALKETFLSYYWSLADSILSVIEDYRKKANEVRESILGELKNQTELCEKARPDILPPSADSGSDEVTVTRSDPFFEVMPELQASKVREEALRRELEKTENAVEELYQRMLLLPSPHEDTEGIDGFEGLDVPCPFDMCFAFLLLLDSGSDEVWTYNLAYDVLAYACRALPWAGCHVMNGDDEKEMQIDVELLADLAEKTPGWDENRTDALLYQKMIRSPIQSPDSEYISIARLAFLSTGLIPPRLNDGLAFTKILLGDAEMTEREADIWYAYIMLAHAVAHKEQELLGMSEEEDAGESEDRKNAEEEIRALKNEIKNLRSRVNRLEHRNREYKQQLSKTDRELKASVTELSELRSMIRESVNSGEESPVSVAFPYTSKKRAVIIGGHPSWVNAVKPLLENVRFISSHEQPHPGVIMNAEVVWLQTNALGHSGYYKIIDIIRRNNIKVCYFSYASAEKCAEQFALEDMGDDAEPVPEQEETE